MLSARIQPASLGTAPATGLLVLIPSGELILCLLATFHLVFPQSFSGQLHMLERKSSTMSSFGSYLYKYVVILNHQRTDFNVSREWVIPVCFCTHLSSARDILHIYYVEDKTSNIMLISGLKIILLNLTVFVSLIVLVV